MKIYLIRNLVNDKMYVGQTRNSLIRRWTEHKSSAKLMRECALAGALRKHGVDAFSIEPLHTCITKEEMDFVEMFYISLLETKAPKGYNLTDGGDYVFDRTGSILSPEHIAAIRRGTLGHKHPPRTEEWRKKQRISHLGQKPSEETKKKRSDGLRRAHASGKWGTLGKG